MTRDPAQTYPFVGVIAGEPRMGERIRDVLRAHFGRQCAIVYTSIRDALTGADKLDVVVLVGGDGIDAGEGVDQVCGAAPTLPVLVLVGSEHAGDVVELIQRGALEAGVMGEDPTWLDASLPMLVEKTLALSLMRGDADLSAAGARAEATRLRAEKAALEERVSRLEAAAWTDPLTGLANRRQIEERLPQMFAEAARYGTDLSCLLIDLDGFKQVNDTRGHAEGDSILRTVGELLEGQIRASDIAARYGGDEFLLLMPRSGCNTAARVARRLFEAFGQRFSCEEGASCGMSIGIACLKRNAPLDGAGLVNLADLAMYASKKAGRNRVMVCAPGGGFEEVDVAGCVKVKPTKSREAKRAE
jgi:diguanylate cyclase (GGDEF)-like protein